MTAFKYFNVKSGGNKGHYIAIDNTMSWEEQCEIMGSNNLNFGAIQDHNIGFYKYHGCLDKKTIWLISSYYTGHKMTEERLQKIKEILFEKGLTEE